MSCCPKTKIKGPKSTKKSTGKIKGRIKIKK